MAESCTGFTPHIWKPNICRDCLRNREDHSSAPFLNEAQTADIPLSTSHELADDNDQDVEVCITEDDKSILPLCRYGVRCYRINPDHFERYSHPPDHERLKHIENSPHQTGSSPTLDSGSTSPTQVTPSSRRKSDYRKKLAKQKRDELQILEDVERRVRELNDRLQLNEQEIDQLRQEKMNILISHQNLEKILQEETELKERHDFERKNVLSIPKQIPSYWGPNAFSESYREIEISKESPEYQLINDLVNSTIKTHGDRFGTIYGKDPTEFLITQIKRIQNAKLWHEYCFKKDGIIRKNNNRLPSSGGSLHLESYPLLTPLLDSHANEYWLFHGCRHDILHDLFHSGYDPRVSNLKGMFGGGFYLAENSSKSNQYIPCPKCNRNSIGTGEGCQCPNQEDLIYSIVLYRAVLGDVHVALQYDAEKYRNGTGQGNRIRRPPMKIAGQELYDSVMGESTQNGGNRLQHREFILYEQGQAYPEYRIDFRRSTKNSCQPTDIKQLLNRCRFFLNNTFRSVPE